MYAYRRVMGAIFDVFFIVLIINQIWLSTVEEFRAVHLLETNLIMTGIIALFLFLRFMSFNFLYYPYSSDEYYLFAYPNVVTMTMLIGRYELTFYHPHFPIWWLYVLFCGVVILLYLFRAILLNILDLLDGFFLAVILNLFLIHKQFHDSGVLAANMQLVSWRGLEQALRNFRFLIIFAAIYAVTAMIVVFVQSVRAKKSRSNTVHQPSSPASEEHVSSVGSARRQNQPHPYPAQASSAHTVQSSQRQSQQRPPVQADRNTSTSSVSQGDYSTILNQVNHQMNPSPQPDSASAPLKKKK